MQQILSSWAGLDSRRRVMAGISALAVLATLAVMGRLATSPGMSLLYAGLDGISAGEVVRALEQQNVDYQVRGDSIYVAANSRDALRMTLAADGLPANGGRGYELLDGLSGFGTTSQMFDAAYWRAKEGELARTIVASPHIAQARVHIANGSTSPFQRSVKPTASVSIVPAGGAISAEQARALRFLISSAVAGLESSDVAVIDANGVVVDVSQDAAATGSNAEDRADALREKVLRLVEARVGRGNAVVEVSVETVTETESIRERRFDPNGRVAISTDTEERSNTASETGGTVTVASNLPDGDAANGGTGSAETSEVRERVNYEVSEVEREVLRSPGSVRRLTIAVLVNNLVQPGGSDAESGTQPRDEAELAALRELVASAVGYDEARGDVITLKSMDLPSVAPQGTLAGNPRLDLSNIDIMQLAQMAVLALVALGLAIFVVRPVLTAPPVLPVTPTPALPPISPADVTAEGEAAAGTAMLADDTATADPNRGPLIDQPARLPVSAADAGENAADRLRSLIGERQTETIEILRNWLEDEERAQ